MKILEILGSLIESVAPTIAGSLFGPTAKNAVQSISNSIFGDSTHDASQVVEALKNDPKLLLKLKELEHEYSMAELKNRTKQIEDQLRDVASARNMQISTKSRFTPVLAAVVCTGFFAILTMMIFKTVPRETMQTINIMVGFLGGSFVSVISFYFGSSLSSHNKDKMLSEAKLAGR